MSDPTFVCQHCAASHSLPTFEWPYPPAVLSIPPAEQEARVALHADACIIDQREFYLRGCIEIPVAGESGPFVWGVWARVPEDAFRRYCSGPDGAGTFLGELPCVPPIYPESTPQVRIQSRPRLRPRFDPVDPEHPIAIHQREGLTQRRVHDIAEIMQHPTHADLAGYLLHPNPHQSFLRRWTKQSLPRRCADAILRVLLG